MSEAIKARVASRGWVTRAAKALAALVAEDDVDLIELQASCDEFDMRMQRFDYCQDAVEVVISEELLDADIQESAKFREESRVPRIAAVRILRGASDAGSVSSSRQSVTEKVKMPKLDLPRFSGDSLKWTEFWEPFEATVDKSDMSDVAKFSYLKSLLDGEAKATVQGLTLTAAHYKEACTLLKGRYGRSERIIFAHVQELLQLSIPGRQVKVSALWEFYNKLQGHVRSLEALGVDGAKYGVVLTPVVLSRLPPDLRLEWAREGESKESDLTFLLEFLHTELKRRERSQTFSSSMSTNGAEAAATEKRNIPSVPTAAALHTVGSGDSPCPICKRSGHPTHRCYSVTRAPLQDRKLVLQKAGCCFKCLASGSRNKQHNFKRCNAKCGKCGGAHHAIICGAESKDSQNSHSNVQHAPTFTQESPQFGAPPVTHANPQYAKPPVTHASPQFGATPVTHAYPQFGKPPVTHASPQFGASPVTHASPQYSPQSHMLTPVKNVSESHTGVSCARASVLLQTAKIKVQGISGITEAVVLFDTGSDKTYISQRLVSKVNPEWVCSESVAYASFGASTPSRSEVRNVFNIKLACENNTLKSVVATEIPVICTPLFCPSIPQDLLASLDGAPVVSVCSGEEVTVDMLIGLDHYWKLVTPEMYSLPNGLVAQRTLFGWIVSGCANTGSSLMAVSHPALVCSSFYDFSEKAMHSFWDLESVGGDVRPGVGGSELSGDDLVLQQFEESLTFAGGRYQVSLPWKNPSAQTSLLDNTGLAMGRFKRLRSKLAGTPELQSQYHGVIQDYVDQSFIEEVPAGELQTENPVFYLPHRPVVKPSSTSTKVRPVFDASARGYNGVSLNDCLEAGPCMIPNLPGILIRFRRWKVALCADVTKAFLNIEVRPEDRDVHRFFWDDDGRLRVMRFLRLPFGNRSSPFLLNATVKSHLSRFPQSKVVEELSQNLFVDDLLSGCDDDQEGCEMVKEADEVMGQAGFTFSKWASNSQVVGELLDREFVDRTATEDSMKVLGMQWVAPEDSFRFDGVSVPEEPCISKRFILSCIARLFDPLGLLTPFLVTAKLLFQGLWRDAVDWDVVVPESIQKQFLGWIKGFEVIRLWRIPRSYTGGRWDDILDMHLHSFGDASQVAYGAVVYLCVQLKDGRCTSSFVFSKAKVAPLKSITLPRLELLAALLCARLLVYVRDSLMLPSQVTYTCWTDSMVTLAWIQSNPSKWKPFVSNRVAMIQDLTDPSHWRHCPGKENPADLVTRGLSAGELVTSSLWLQGPDFLRDDDHGRLHLGSMGECDGCESHVLEEAVASSRVLVTVDESSTEVFLPVERWSSFGKVIRILAWVQRFIHNVRQPRNSRSSGDLSLQEMCEAKLKLFRAVQKQEFIEYVRLAGGHSVGRKSPLFKLNPFLDTEGLIRVQGRLQFSGLPYESMHPVILPRCHFSLLLVRHMHQSLKHAGVNVMLVHLRDHYWIISARRICKQVKRDCVACKQLDANPGVQPMAPLPRARVSQAPAFSVTGIDHGGPLYCCDKGSKKYYILLFTCAVVRAVHLELVDALSADATMAAIRRFVSRRGLPSVIMSDNAKGFVAAKDLITRFYGPDAPDWRFSVPRAPWWGGFWERLIQTVKSALKRSVGRKSLTRVELETTLHEIESCVNSRPLTFVGDDVEAAAPLTPNHFLLGRASGTSSLKMADEDPVVSVQDLAERQVCRNQLLGHFWSTWSSDYIRNLPPATGVHGKDLQVGSVVLVQDEARPRLQWPWGVVQQIFPGKDGIVRAAEVRTTKGLLKRPVQKLFDLEVNDSVENLAQAGGTEIAQSLDVQTPGTAGLDSYPVSNKASAATVAEPERRTKSGRLVKNPCKLDL